MLTGVPLEFRSQLRLAHGPNQRPDPLLIPVRLRHIHVFHLYRNESRLSSGHTQYSCSSLHDRLVHLTGHAQTGLQSPCIHPGHGEMCSPAK